MKAFVRIFSLVLVTVLLCAMLMACGDIKSGEYYFGDIGLNYNYESFVFKGSKFTHTTYVDGTAVESYSGKYEIVEDVEEGTKTITFTWGEKGAEQTATYDFASYEEEGTIVIGITEFTPMPK